MSANVATCITVLDDMANSTSSQASEAVIDPALKILQCMLLSLSTLLLLLLNTMCLFVLRRVDGIQQTTKVFMASMTAADLGVGIFMALPMTISAISETWRLKTTR